MEKYNIKEVCQILNLSEPTLRRYIKSGDLKGEIPFKKKAYVFYTRDIQAFAKKMKYGYVPLSDKTDSFNNIKQYIEQELIKINKEVSDSCMNNIAITESLKIRYKEYTKLYDLIKKEENANE